MSTGVASTVETAASDLGAGLPAEDVVRAKAGQENFPVASRLLPRSSRRHLLAVYGFARLADDIGDEGSDPPEVRLERLAWLTAQVDLAFTGQATHPIMRTLTPTIRACGLSPDPFHQLIEANRQDQLVTRYATWDDLRSYCELSANPVGRLVLQVFAVDDAERRRLSDDVCTGLQLAEHLQDVGEDAARGRVYLPMEDLAQEGCDEADLRAAHASRRLRRVVAMEAARTRPLLESGRSLTATLRGRPRLAVAAFTAGGHAALDAIERAAYDVLGHKVRPARRQVARRMLSVVLGAGEAAGGHGFTPRAASDDGRQP
ncbi:MAG: squalene synthase HpnC [Acidimicrobiales bacterium]